MVEVEDLLAEVRVFQQSRAAGAEAQGVLVVRDGNALRRGQDGDVAAGDLMGLAARTLGFGIAV